MEFFQNSKKEKKNFEDEFNMAYGAACNEIFSSAAAEYFKAIPDLLKNANRKVHPDFVNQNMNQHAGFSAETMHVANTNAENILRHSNVRLQTTDRLGFRNDPVSDYVMVDAKGNPLRNPSGEFLCATQSKFFSDPQKYDKLLSDKLFEKYKSVNIDVPKDHYSEFMDRLNKEQAKLKVDLETRQGTPAGDKIKTRLDRVTDLKKRVKPSSLTKDEAMAATKHPVVIPVENIGKVALKSGASAAGTAAATTAVFSGVRNLVKAGKGEISIEQAAKEIAWDSARSAGDAFATQSAATLLGGALKASQSKMLQSLSKEGGPTAIIMAGKMLCTNVKDLVQGKLTPSEFVEKTGGDSMVMGASLYGSNIGAVMGTMICPGVGTVVGSLVGTLVCSTMMQAAIEPLKRASIEARMAEEYRDKVKKITDLIIKQEREYREVVLKNLEVILDKKEKIVYDELGKVVRSIMAGEDIAPNLKVIADTLFLNVDFYSGDDMNRMLVENKTIYI